MPIDPDRPAGGPRRVKGPGRPPPWVTRGGEGRVDRTGTIHGPIQGPITGPRTGQTFKTTTEARIPGKTVLTVLRKVSLPVVFAGSGIPERGGRFARPRKPAGAAAATRRTTAGRSTAGFGGGGGGGDGGARVQTRRGVALEAKGLRWIISRRGTGSRLGAAGS